MQVLSTMVMLQRTSRNEICGSRGYAFTALSEVDDNELGLRRPLCFRVDRNNSDTRPLNFGCSYIVRILYYEVTVVHNPSKFVKPTQFRKISRCTISTAYCVFSPDFCWGSLTMISRQMSSFSRFK